MNDTFLSQAPLSLTNQETFQLPVCQTAFAACILSS